MTIRQVTVFGGSGFIGRHVVQRLARRGIRVAVAVRRPRRAEFVRPMGDVGQVMPIAADIRDDASVAAAVAGADGVVNLVGILYESGRRSFSAIHAEGAARVARAAAQAGARRLVHLSAIGADAQAASDYARSKAQGEQAVRAAFPAATILRPSLVFGPDDGFFNRFAAMARIAPALPLFGGGETRYQPVYVGDVADAAIKGLLEPETAGKTYELGGPRVYTFEEMMRLMLAETGRKRCLVKLPFFAADVIGRLGPLLPRRPGRPPVLTRDQARLLRHDNVVADGALGLADLGIAPTACEVILPTYLDRYRKTGRYA